jgi:hypothetical protein
MLNPGTLPVVVTVDLYAPWYNIGVSPYATTDRTLEPGKKISLFLSELFPNLPPNDGGGSKVTTGYIRLHTKNGDKFCLTALKSSNIDGNFLMSFIPVFPGR